MEEVRPRMVVGYVLEASSLNAKQAAHKWKAAPENVRKWCRNGYVEGASKSSSFPFAWSIPANARRPIDELLMREALWQIVELQNNRIRELDLTEWGVLHLENDDLLLSLGEGWLLQSEGDGSGWSLTRKGFAILDRGGSGTGDEKTPKIINWIASGAGAFAGSAIKQIVTP